MEEGKKVPRILVCDDDEILLNFMRRLLTTRGLEVITAVNGDQAMEILEHEPVSLAVIDLLMPVRSGWEVIEFMKHDPKLRDIPVVAITGLAPVADEMAKIQALCTAVFHKGADFDFDEFNALIHRLL